MLSKKEYLIKFLENNNNFYRKSYLKINGSIQ